MSALNGTLKKFEEEFELKNVKKNYEERNRDRINFSGDMDYFMPKLDTILSAMKKYPLEGNDYQIRVSSREKPSYFGLLDEEGREVADEQKKRAQYKTRKQVKRIEYDMNQKVKEVIPKFPKLNRTEGDFWISTNKFNYDKDTHDFVGDIYSTIYVDKFDNFDFFKQPLVKKFSKTIDHISMHLPTESSHWMRIGRKRKKEKKIIRPLFLEDIVEKVPPKYPIYLMISCGTDFSVRDEEIEALADIFKM